MNKNARIKSIKDSKFEGIIVLARDDENIETIFNHTHVVYHFSDYQNKQVTIDSVFVLPEDKEYVDKLLHTAIEDIYEADGIPIPACKEAISYFERLKNKEKSDSEIVYVKDILPDNSDGSKKLNDENELLFIEYPVRKACKIFKDNNIQTIMSSANAEDVNNRHLPETDYIGQNQHFSIGNGYAWIMLKYDSLNEENKSLIHRLNSGETEISLSDHVKEIFNYNCRLNGTKPNQSELVKFYRIMDSSFIEPPAYYNTHFLSEEELSKVNPKLVDALKNTRDIRRRDILIAEIKSQLEALDSFYSRAKKLNQHNSLSFEGTDYKAVVIRYPIDEKTKVAEVSEYFTNLALMFKFQEIKKPTFKIISRK